jgi:hypothetical protein
MITGKEQQAIKKVYNYLLHDEKNHWEEEGRPVKHIYMAIRDLTWLATGKRPRKLTPCLETKKHYCVRTQSECKDCEFKTI